MNTTLLTTITTKNQALQRIRTTDGPAPLMVSFVEIKTLFANLLTENPGNLIIIEAVQLLQERGWQDASRVLDYYEEDQEEDYQISFYRLQALVTNAVNTIQQA